MKTHRTTLKVLATIAFVIVSGSIFLPTAYATYIPTDTAVLRWLDKVTGRVNTLDALVGNTVRLGTLSISVENCMTRPPEETPESGAFLHIWETKPGEESVKVFSGWMFASSPALSAMEHPVYDVWVLDCENRRRSISE